MTFAWPFLLWLLLLPAALLLWELTHRRRAGGFARPKILRAEAGAHSLTLATPGAPLPTDIPRSLRDVESGPAEQQDLSEPGGEQRIPQRLCWLCEQRRTCTAQPGGWECDRCRTVT